MRYRLSACLTAIVASASLHAAINPSDLELVAWPDASTTFSEPVAVRAPAGDDRVFVVERCDDPGNSNTSGHVRIVKNGALLPTAFLSVPVSCSSEQGLLGLAFPHNGFDFSQRIGHVFTCPTKALQLRLSF